MTSKPDPRLAPLPKETTPELSGAFQTYVKVLGFIPNSVLIMQRKPKIVQALSQLAAAIWDPESDVPVAFKRLVRHLSPPLLTVAPHAHPGSTQFASASDR